MLCYIPNSTIVRFFHRNVISLSSAVWWLTTMSQPFNAVRCHDIIASLIWREHSWPAAYAKFHTITPHSQTAKSLFDFWAKISGMFWTSYAESVKQGAPLACCLKCSVIYGWWHVILICKTTCSLAKSAEMSWSMRLIIAFILFMSAHKIILSF